MTGYILLITGLTIVILGLNTIRLERQLTKSRYRFDQCYNLVKSIEGKEFK